MRVFACNIMLESIGTIALVLLLVPDSQHAFSVIWQIDTAQAVMICLDRVSLQPAHHYGL